MRSLHAIDDEIRYADILMDVLHDIADGSLVRHICSVRMYGSTARMCLISDAPELFAIAGHDGNFNSLSGELPDDCGAYLRPIADEQRNFPQ